MRYRLGVITEVVHAVVTPFVSLEELDAADEPVGRPYKRSSVSLESVKLTPNGKNQLVLDTDTEFSHEDDDHD